MPVSARTTAQSTELDYLRPYSFHGVHLSTAGAHAIGDCPFCGREGKFSVEVATGLWRCFVCGNGTERGGGNGLVFTRLVYEMACARKSTERPPETPCGQNGGETRFGRNIAANAVLRNPERFAAAVAADRGLLSPETVVAWGIAQAADGTWLVPGYGTDGKLDQVYRRTRIQDKGQWVWRLLPTPGIGWTEGKAHALHMAVKDFDPARPNITVCEGPWDGMALWETVAAPDTNIIAVPGCNVWQDSWTDICRGKHVTLLFDSDHPREVIAGKQSRAGYDGMARVAKKLSGVAASVRYIKWGDDGYDPEQPSGWDVRDHLKYDLATDRTEAAADLLSKVVDAPREWFNPVSAIVNGHAHHEKSVEALPCSSFFAVEQAYMKAMQWRGELSDALATLLAICASTQQAGNQLFLDLIGSPGSAKTTLCRGLLVSGNCVHLENVTKLISGYKKPDDDKKDCSFIARSNNKTWITCEFDTLANSPQYHDLMGKVRRIFDGETSATYGNSDEDRVYAALRTPWIRAGTPKMMDHDQSQLGDRFVRYILSDPHETERRCIARSALKLERAAILETANGSSGSVNDAKTRTAQALTGGYVDWLRAHVEEELAKIEVDEAAEESCIDLAELSADMRARPQTHSHGRRNADLGAECHDYKEMPTRLARQNIRLATCLAVVFNKDSIDASVLRIVRKVALDTAAGHSLNIVKWLCSINPKAATPNQRYQESGGLMNGILETWTGMSAERLVKYLNFLRSPQIDVVQWKEVRPGHGAWVLTERVYKLYLQVMGGTDGQW